MSQAMMLRDQVALRAVLQTLGSRVQIQDRDADDDPESAAALLARLDGDDREEERRIPELLVAGINRDGGLVFVKTRKQETQGVPVWINLNVPSPDRFRVVARDAPALVELLAKHADTQR